MPRRLIVGNWKMNGNRESNSNLLQGLLAGGHGGNGPRVVVCVPFPYLEQAAAALADGAIGWGAQDVSAREKGAYTGEVSAAMLSDLGCTHVIVGHSERRQYHGESSELVAEKAARVVERGMTPIVCVGETLVEREADETEAVVSGQLDAVLGRLGRDIERIVVAYEPVWAIGTGRTATPEQAQSVHALLRKRLRDAGADADALALLYGGSVKADNAGSLFACEDIDGGLVGGASLDAKEFLAICSA
jgi:triosephosphate isomerase